LFNKKKKNKNKHKPVLLITSSRFFGVLSKLSSLRLIVDTEESDSFFLNLFGVENCVFVTIDGLLDTSKFMLSLSLDI